MRNTLLLFQCCEVNHRVRQFNDGILKRKAIFITSALKYIVVIEELKLEILSYLSQKARNCKRFSWRGPYGFISFNFKNRY